MRLPAERRWKLERMRRLLDLFDHPQKSFLPVLIAGTKGKGSTGFFLQSILNAADIPAGFYSSPHLETPRERIRIQGKIISKPLWVHLLTQIRRKLGKSVIASPDTNVSVPQSGGKETAVIASPDTNVSVPQSGGKETAVIASPDANASVPQSDVKGGVVIAGEAKQSQVRDCFVAKNAPRNDELIMKLLEHVTYFEIMTLMAALTFKEQGMRIGIFEAGMGGRLDATNALRAKIIVLTPIGLDHQEFLGNTVAAIASEKAAVIHAGADAILAPQSPQAMRVIRARAKQMNARLWPVTQTTRFKTGLLGDHQRWNAAVAIKAAEILSSRLPRRPPLKYWRTPRNDASLRALTPMRQYCKATLKVASSLRALTPMRQYCKATLKVASSLRAKRSNLKQCNYFTIPLQAIRKGVAANDWPGRFEILRGKPNVILDGAHNPVAIKVLIQTLRAQRLQGPVVLIFGVTRDKDSELMLKELSGYFNQIILTALSTSRGKTVPELLSEARRFFPMQIPSTGVSEALTLGRSLTGAHGWVVVTGSFYLIGAARQYLKQ